MLSSVAGGGGDDAAAVFNVDTGAGGDMWAVPGCYGTYHILTSPLTYFNNILSSHYI